MKMKYLASEIMEGRVNCAAIAQKNIQSNYGYWPGYVGQQPVAFTATAFLFATAERLSGIEADAVTEYNGFWVENDTGLHWSEIFPKICAAARITFVPA